MSPAQLADLQRLELLTYTLLPIVLALRVSVTALVLQLFTTLIDAGLPYRHLLRASLWGFAAALYGLFLQTLRLDLLGPDLTMLELTVVPDSLAALIMSPPRSVALGYAALSLLNLHNLIWIGILFAYFRFECRVPPRTALFIPVATWAVISLTQLGLQAFTAQIMG